MGLNVNHNIAAINAQRSISRNVNSVNKQLHRLSSGLRVNGASDDASGLVISEGLRSEVARLGQNVRNAQQGSDLLQVAEGSLQEVSNILVRMRELAIESSTSTLNDANREAVAAEYSQLISEIDRIAQATTFNNQTLLTGFGNQVSAASTALTTSPTTGVSRIAISAAQADTFTFVDAGSDGLLTLGNGATSQTLSIGTLLDGTTVATGTSVVANFDRLGIQVTLVGPNAAGAPGRYVDGDLDGANIIIESGTGGVFQVGPSDSFFNRLEVGIPDLRATGLALNLADTGVSSIGTARAAITSIDAAIETVSNARGDLGAGQNRLAFSIGFTEVEIENLTSAEATIRDADVALEVTALSRGQILIQTSNAMLVQANVGSIQALSLL